MYAVSILLKNSALSQSFYFKAFKKADELFKALSSNIPPLMPFEDDYGAKGSFLFDQLAGISFTDIEEDMKRQGEMQVIQHKAQLRTQQLAKADPQLQLMTSSSKIVSAN